MSVQLLVFTTLYPINLADMVEHEVLNFRDDLTRLSKIKSYKPDHHIKVAVGLLNHNLSNNVK